MSDQHGDQHDRVISFEGDKLFVCGPCAADLRAFERDHADPSLTGPIAALESWTGLSR